MTAHAGLLVVSGLILYALSSSALAQESNSSGSPQYNLEPQAAQGVLQGQQRGRKLEEMRRKFEALVWQRESAAIRELQQLSNPNIAKVDPRATANGGIRGPKPGGAGKPPPKYAGARPSDPVGDLGKVLPNKQPRSVVKPGAIPTGNSLVSSVTTEVWDDTTITTTRDDRTGATQRIEMVQRDPEGRLTAFSYTRVREDGSSTTTFSTVEYVGPNDDVPVVTSFKSERPPTGGIQRPVELGTRPHAPSDPPVRPEPTRKTPELSSLPREDHDGGGKLPLGIECNPVLNTCNQGMALGNNQVNPSREVGVNNAPGLSVDPRDLVVNPGVVNTRTPAEIKVVPKAIGPGGRPPESGSGKPAVPPKPPG